jgi:D-alanyl-D-alanine carboxypeptidase
MKPLFIPGTGYSYSDTGYILLGLIIENISGMDLHDFFKLHIFKPLNMNNTYMHLRNEPILPTENMVELYVNNLEISTFKSLSLDWAGGGLVSTAQDLNRFQVALFNHGFLKAETLKKMQKWKQESKGLYYGYGLRKVRTSERFPYLTNLSLIGHTGSTSSFMFYCPELDIYLSGTFNQTSSVKQSLMTPIKILTSIKRYVDYEM